MTFKELAESWLESNRTKRPSTKATDESALENYILPVLRSRRIGKVTVGDVQGLVNLWTKDHAIR